MKPCSKNRKLIAWLAIDALDKEKLHALHDHFAVCKGCRQYWEEIKKVTQGLASVQPTAHVEGSEAFHKRVAQKLQAVESAGVLERLRVSVRRTFLSWRVAVPVGTALIIGLIAVMQLRNHPTVSSAPGVQIVSSSGSGTELAPSIANYEMVASQSLDKFSELLSSQGNRGLPRAPLYTASGVQVNASF